MPLKLDVAVPVGAARRARGRRARRRSARHGGRLVPFGHLAEGNVHLNVLDAGDPGAITAEVLAAAADARRHDLGRARRRHRQGRWLHLVRSPAELAAAAAVKHALDPAGILNPGVLAPELTVPIASTGADSDRHGQVP